MYTHFFFIFYKLKKNYINKDSNLVPGDDKTVHILLLSAPFLTKCRFCINFGHRNLSWVIGIWVN